MAIAKDEKNNRYYITYKMKMPDGTFKTRNIKVDEHGSKWAIRGEGKVSRSYMLSIEQEYIEKDKATNGAVLRHNESNPSVSELVSAFLSSQDADGIEHSTIYNYELAYKNYLYPIVGETTRSDKAFSVPNIDRFKANMRAKSLSPRTTNNKLTALKKLISFARKRHYVDRDTADDALDLLDPIREVETAKSRKNYLYSPVEDAKKLFATFDNEDTEWKIPFLTMFYGALRIGEWQGLKVQDCDFAKNTLLICRQVDSSGKEKSKTKTGCAMPVHLPSDFMLELKGYIEDRKLNGDDFIFCGAYGGAVGRSTARRMLDKHLKMADLPHITLHGLRHSFATYMFESGFDVKIVQTQLRHSSMGTTMDYYIHLTQGQENELMNGLSLGVKK